MDFKRTYLQKTAITQFIEQILQAQGNGKFTVSIFLDLKKSFDTLDQDILLNKFNTGIRNAVRSYFYDRGHCTIFNDVIPKSAKVITDVPRGSTLGPLYFLLYISDIIQSTKILKYTLFPDDTSIIYSGSDIISLSKNNKLGINLCLLGY